MCGSYKDEKVVGKIVLTSSSEKISSQNSSTFDKVWNLGRIQWSKVLVVADLMSKTTLKMTHLGTMKIIKTIIEQHEELMT